MGAKPKIDAGLRQGLRQTLGETHGYIADKPMTIIKAYPEFGPLISGYWQY